MTKPAAILVVEDDPLVQAVIKLQLEHRGHSVMIAEHAAEAKRLLDEKDGDFKLLIIDSGLPIQSGESVAMELKSRFPEPGVLMISGYPEGRRREESTKSDLPFLQKPFTGAQLVQKVDELLAKQSSN